MRLYPRHPIAGCEKYNEIFNQFPDELDLVFSERLPITLQSYVPVPKVENAILDFTQRPYTCAVGLLWGYRGVGKSSVLEYLKLSKWAGANCELILDNLSSRSEGLSLGSDYYQLPDPERWHRASTTASECVGDAIATHLHGAMQLDSSFPASEWLKYAKLLQPKLIEIPDGIAGKSPKDIFVSAWTANPTISRNFLAYFLLVHSAKQHFKFVIDDLDDKDALLVMAMAEQLAHLQKFFWQCSQIETKETGAEPRRLSPLIACRPNTRDALIEPMSRRRFGNDWFVFKPLEFNPAHILGEMIRRRYKAFIAERPFSHDSSPRADTPVDDRSISLPARLFKGHNVKIPDRDALFLRLCSEFESTGQAVRLLELCNFDFADAMCATLDVFRNRHFVKIDNEYVKMVISSQESERHRIAQTKVFTPTTVLRALGYGNQEADAPMYPISRSRVPNVLESADFPFASSCESFFKLRLIGLLCGADRSSSTPLGAKQPLSAAAVCELAQRFFYLKPTAALSILDEMYLDALILHDHKHAPPSLCGPNCSISGSPRAKCIWQNLAADSILLQMYREDIELQRGIEWKGRPHEWCLKLAYASALGSTEVPADFPWIIAQMWGTERPHLDLLINDYESPRFEEVFGKIIISEHLLQGVRKGIDGFWSREADTEGEDQLKEIKSMIETLQGEIDTYKAAIGW